MTISCTFSENMNPLIREGLPNRQFQDSCKQLNAVDVVVEFLKTLFLSAQEGGHLAIPGWLVARNLIESNSFATVLLAWRFLKQVVKQNPSGTGQQLAQHSSFIASQLKTEFGIVDTYIALYSGNFNLVSSIQDDTISDIIDIINSEHDKGHSFGDAFVQLLTILCSCNGTPLVANQTRVFHSFVKGNSHQLAYVDKKGQTLWLAYQNSKTRLDIPLENMIGRYKAIVQEGKAANPSEELYAYYIQCMQLYAMLLKGRNHVVEEFLMDNADKLGLGYHTIVWSISAERVPWTVKALGAQIMIEMYIDRDPYQTMPPIQMVRCLPRYSHIWASRANTLEVLYGRHEAHRPEPNFTNLKSIILQYTRATNGEFTITSPEKNALTSMIAVVASSLLNFGFFHVGDTPRLQDTAADFGMSSFLEPFMALLDGRNDEEVVKGERFVHNEKNHAILTTKELICNMAQYVFSCCVEAQIKAIFTEYEKQMETLQHCVNVESDPMGCLLEHGKIEPFLRASSNLSLLNDKSDFCLCMLDICQYEYIPLVLNAMTLLCKFFGRVDEMHRSMLATQVITSEAGAKSNVQLMIDVKKLAANVRWIGIKNMSREKGRAVHESLDIVTRLDSQLDAATRRDDGSLQNYQQMLKNTGAQETLLQILRFPVPSSEIIFNGLNYQDIVDIITEEFDNYDMDESGYIDREVELPQLVSSLIMRIKIKVTRQDLEQQLSTAFRNAADTRLSLQEFQNWFLEVICNGNQNIEHRHLVAMCYQLIGSLVQSNPESQMDMFQSWDMFFAHMELKDVRSALSMVAVLKDNEELHDRITQEEVNAIVHMLCKEHCTDWVMLLQAMVWLHKLKRRHAINAQMVSGAMAKNPMCLNFVGPDAPRLDPYLVSTGAINPGTVSYHIAMMELQVMMCQGKAEACEVRAQALMSYEQAMSVLLETIDVLEHDTIVAPNNPVRLTHNIRFCLLRLRSVYLHYIFEIFIDSGSATTRGHVQMFDNGLWQLPANRNGRYGLSKPAMRDMHSLLTRFLHLERASRSKVAKQPLSEQHEYILLLSWTYNIAVPMLKGYYTSHHRESADPGGDVTQKLADCIINLRPFANLENDQILTRCLMEMQDYCEVRYEVRESFEPRNDVVVVKKSIFQTMWKVFVVWYTEETQMPDPTSHIGAGAMLLSEVLSTGGHIHDPVKIQLKKPLQQYRQPVWRIYKMLTEHSDQMSSEVVLQLLVVCRALVYMDDPNVVNTMKELREHALVSPSAADELRQLEEFCKANWRGMVADEPPKKSEPSDELLEWVQNKYNMLGCTRVIISLTSSPDPSITLAAVKFGIAVLQGGNKFVQDCLLQDLKDLRQDAEHFLARCESYIAGTKQTLIDRTLLKKALRDITELTKGECRPRWSVREGSDRAGPRLDSLPEEIRLHENTELIKATISMIRFLQLMAEGHHQHFQEYLREQPDNLNSYNLLTTVCNLMTDLSSHVESYVIEDDNVVILLFLQVCEFLIEVMQGPCFKNQEVLCSGDLITNCNRCLGALQQMSTDQSAELLLSLGPHRARSKIRNTVINICQAAIEGSRNPKRPRVIISKIDATILIQNILTTLTLHLDAVEWGLKIDPCWGEALVAEAFNTYFLCLALNSFDVRDGEFPVAMRGLEEGYPRVHTFLASLSAAIEIFRDGYCYTTFFQIPIECTNLMEKQVFRDQSTERINSIPRDNPDEKAFQLLKNLLQLTDEMVHLNNILLDPRFWWAVQYKELISSAPFYMSVLIVVGLVLLYNTEEDRYFGIIAIQIFYDVCVWFHILLNGSQTLIYFMVTAPMEFIPFDDSGPVINDGESYSAWLTPDGDTREAYELAFPAYPTVQDTRTVFQKTLEYGKYHPQAWYVTIVFLLSICGATYNVFFHAFILVEYLRTPAGRLVMRAVKAGAPKMSKTFMMGIVMMLMWTMLSWKYYHNWLDEVSEACKTVYQCTFAAVQAGFRGDLNGLHGDTWGNIRGDYQTPLAFYEDLGYQIQVIMVLLYFLMWEFILSGIIQGQIIDAFAEMRADEDARIADMHERCMVCSLSRFEVDSAGGKFHQHVSQDHVPINYLFFFVYLAGENPADDSGMMSYVRECVAKRDIAFIPIATCQMMNRDESLVLLSNENIHERLIELKNTTSAALTKLEGKVSKLSKVLSQAIARLA